MNDKYVQWIRDYETREGSVWMKCVDGSIELQRAFPELRIVRGVAVSRVSGKRWCHQWCVTPDGVVVDPTAAQFNGHVTYEGA